MDDIVVHLRTLAESGNGAAAWEIATRYRTGQGLSQNLEAAFDWYRRAAALGDREAQNDLGTMLLEGLGCAADKAQAVSWYRRSALQGCADAQWNLGKRYLHNDGVEKDSATAYHWFSKAALLGHRAALCDMGTMHWLGDGVERSVLAAADFHLLAAGMGDQLACENLPEYRPQVEELALSGSQIASLFLCRMHNRGHGAEKSQAMTYAWIAWAHQVCPPDSDPEVVEEVRDAYAFYHRHIESNERSRGSRALAALRRKRSATKRRKRR